MTSTEFYVYVLLDMRKPGPYRYGRWVFTMNLSMSAKEKDDAASLT